VSSVSKSELRDIFIGASTSLKDSMQVTPVLLKQGAVQNEFLSLYIGKSDSGFRAGWRSVLFSGQGMMPKTLDSEAAVVEYVAHTPGAIGYIGRSAPHEGVKVLAVR
jgi:ABC-type phosphate transport system substrate-binding protein